LCFRLEVLESGIELFGSDESIVTLNSEQMQLFVELIGVCLGLTINGV
jgi:hypothetical protein